MIYARTRSLLWLLVLLGSAFALRAPFLDRVLWNLDEAVTVTMAQQIREGGVLYRDTVDHRGPLVPYLKAAILAISGDWNTRAIHVTLALTLGLVAWLLRDLGRKLGEPLAGSFAAAIFIFLSLLFVGPAEAFAAHTEWFVVFFSSLGFWLFARSHRTGGFIPGLLIGGAFAASALSKQPGILDFATFAVISALLYFREPSVRQPSRQLWFGVGTSLLVLALAVGGYFWAHGAFDAFLYYAWRYNTTLYVPEIPLLSRWSALFVPAQLGFLHIPTLFALAIAASGVLAVLAIHSLPDRTKPIPTFAWLILGWIVSSVIACALSGRDFGHYSIQLVPGLSLAAGWLLARAFDYIRRPGAPPALRLALALLFLVVIGDTLCCAVVAFSKTESRDDPRHLELAALLKRHSSPDERLFVWGYFPEAHLFSQRLPATRFVYANFLSGLIPWTNLEYTLDTRYAVVPDAWSAFWSDYRATPPALILEAITRGYVKYPLLAQPALRDELIAHYAEVDRHLAEPLQMRLYRRLAPLSPAFSPDAPLDPSITLHPAAISSSPDLFEITVRTPHPAKSVTLRRAGQPLRHIVLPNDHPTETTFFLRLADFTAPLATSVDAVVDFGEHHATSPALDLTGRLTRDLPPFNLSPVLAYGLERISPSLSSSASWHFAPVGPSTGWTTSDAFHLDFPRPDAATRLSFEWQPPGRRPDAPPSPHPAPELFFLDAVGHASPLPLRVTLLSHDRQQFTASLPPGSGHLRLNWDPAQHPPQSSNPAVWIGQLRAFAAGPAFLAREFSHAPTIAESPSASPWTSAAPDPRWTTRVPARVVYPRPQHVESFVLDYGLAEQPSATGSIAVEVNFLHPDGRSENLFSRILESQLRPEDRQRQSSRVELPHHAPGHIEVKFGATSPDASPPPVYLHPLRAQGPGPDLVLSPDRILLPAESTTASGEPIRTQVNGRWIAHAPGFLVYPCPGDLHAVEFGFGLEEAAYRNDDGSPRSNGVYVYVEFRDDSEQPIELFARTLDPFNNPADRGPQKARIVTPGRPGRLVFYLHPGLHNDAAYDWSYWTDFTGEIATPSAP